MLIGYVLLSCKIRLQQTDDGEGGQPMTSSIEGARTKTPSSPSASSTGPKRLHVSNLPFRYREADLRNLLQVRSRKPTNWLGRATTHDYRVDKTF